MIRKLKIKFVVINMLLAGIVLNVSFFIIGISTYQRLSSESLSALKASFSKNELSVSPKRKIDKPSVQLDSMVFNVKLSKNKEKMTLIGDKIEIDNDLLVNLVETCLKSGKKNGTISELQLRYLIKESEEGTELAFYDLTNDIHTMTNLIKNFILVETGSLAAFFFISLFLAKWTLKPLEISWQQQKRFVADASHELKSPLTVILANTDILASHKAETIEQQYKWLSYIRTEASHMSKLVNDLLFLANADAFRGKPLFSKVNLSDAIWNCYIPFESLAYEQNKVLKNTIESDLYINGDEVKLKQLVMILLDNACKYTDKNGQIHVCLQQKQDKVNFSVTNSGTPIAPQHLPHIFERFYRADKSRTRETGGYGLGLSIAKTIAGMLIGRISAASSPEEGTTFTVVFPAYK